MHAMATVQQQVLDRVERLIDDTSVMAEVMKADHAAAQLTRKAQTLLVMCGIWPARRESRPVSLFDCVRGAQSRIVEFGRPWRTPARSGARPCRTPLSAPGARLGGMPLDTGAPGGGTRERATGHRDTRTESGRWALAEAGDGRALVCPLDSLGAPAGPVRTEPSAAEAVRARPEVARWVWRATSALHPRLLAAGVRVDRCHDVEAAEALLLGHEGRCGAPRSLPAAWARLRGLPVPDDPPQALREADPQPSLFDASPASVPRGTDPLTALCAVYAAQLERVERSGSPAGMRLLLAGESAACLVAVEMSRAGVPWRADVHRALLDELLGERYAGTGEPRRLAELAAEVSRAFGPGARVRPDLPADVLRAFAGRASGSPRPGRGNSRTSTIRRSRRCCGTRSCTASTPRTAGAGCAPGCTTAGSVPSTCPAAPSRDGGPPTGAARCRFRRSCAGRWSPTPAGGWWSRTPTRWSRGCSPRSPATPV